MPRLLVVEDDEMIRDLLRRRLQHAGFDVLTAEDGDRGIDAAREHRPDLILMDLGLPGRDGWEVTRQLKAEPATQPIPVIAVSAHAMTGDRERAQQAGCDDYDTKPVQMPRLLDKIGALLRARGVEMPPPKVPPTRAAAAAPPAPEPPPALLPPPLPPTAATAPTPAPVPVMAASPVPVVEPTQRKRILVVEDNDPNRELLCRRLARQGYEPREAPGGREALDLIRREAFDLVLLDIMMPELDGFQVLELLKSDPEMREIPVIMLSALDTMDGIVRCIELGAEDYLPKPYDPVLLQARITASLDKKRLRDQELAYLRAVADLTTAAAAVEKGGFDPACLAAFSARDDELGRLARVFERMAREVFAREQQLRREVELLRVEIDEQRKHEQVSEITENAYFQSLQSKVQQFRRRARKEDAGNQPGPAEAGQPGPAGNA